MAPVLGTAPVLAVEDLAVHFTPRASFLGKVGPPVKAVDGVSFEIAEGETLGLVGESGCGKSTVSNAVVGLLRPTRGNVRVAGREMTGAGRAALHEARRHVQMIFQDPALSLNPRMTVGAAVGEPLAVRGLARGRALKERVGELLQSVGLKPEHAARFPHQFSGGQRQRIVIARALALEPALVVCDEPVSALDVSVRAQILNLLVDLQRRRRMAYLFVSHDLAVVRHICDRVAVMYLGRLVEVAHRETLFADPKHPYTVALMSAVPEPDPEKQRQKAPHRAHRRVAQPLQRALGLPLPHPLPAGDRFLPAGRSPADPAPRWHAGGLPLCLNRTPRRRLPRSPSASRWRA
jgi:ABC-type oligopeptide transport system ATPase subunit